MVTLTLPSASRAVHRPAAAPRPLLTGHRSALLLAAVLTSTALLAPEVGSLLVVDVPPGTVLPVPTPRPGTEPVPPPG